MSSLAEFLSLPRDAHRPPGADVWAEWRGWTSDATVHGVLGAIGFTTILSQAALGEALGVSRQTINAIETGRYDPSLILAVRLARFFESTVEEVFHFEDN